MVTACCAVTSMCVALDVTSISNNKDSYFFRLDLNNLIILFGAFVSLG